MGLPEAEVDRLYEVAPDQFTATRDALARSLRQAGDRTAADQVKRLRKPSISAWGLNQLSRSHRRAVARLLKAGERLREAQERLLSGGSRDQLRDAVVEERRLVSELSDLAASELEQAGHAAGPAIRTRLQETLHAAAASPEVREQLGHGRLVREQQLSEFGLPFGASPPAKEDEASAPAKPARADAERARREKKLRRALEQARSRQRDLTAAARDSDRAVKASQRELASASTAAERAQAASARAHERLEQAGSQVADLAKQLRDLTESAAG